MSVRVEKVASVIKRALAKPVSDLANELGAGMATVTDVKMSPDLQSAKVYLSVFGGKLSTVGFLAKLEEHKGSIKNAVAPMVQLRFMPDFKFFLDDTLDKMDKLQNVIDDINKGIDNKPIDFDSLKR